MTDKFQPRYVAYATANGRTPDAMLAHDTKRFPGGKMAGFIVWMNEKWQAFDALQKQTGTYEEIKSEGYHARFDAWLNKSAELEKSKRKLASELLRSAREGDGWPVEADESLNDASRRVVDAVRDAFGEAWLGQINLHGSERGKPEHALWKWDGSLVCNFSCAFVLAQKDDTLVELIMQRDRAPYTNGRDDVARIDAIMVRIKEVGGIHLHWT
jgi:hypothetical protein